MPDQSQLGERLRPPMRQLKFRTPEILYQRLKQESKRQDLTMQELLVEALEQGLYIWAKSRP